MKQLCIHVIFTSLLSKTLKLIKNQWWLSSSMTCVSWNTQWLGARTADFAVGHRDEVLFRQLKAVCFPELPSICGLFPLTPAFQMCMLHVQFGFTGHSTGIMLLNSVSQLNKAGLPLGSGTSHCFLPRASLSCPCPLVLGWGAAPCLEFNSGAPSVIGNRLWLKITKSFVITSVLWYCW